MRRSPIAGHVCAILDWGPLRVVGGRDMSRLMIALFITAGLSFGGCAAQRQAPMNSAPMAPMSKDAYDAAVKSAETQYKMDKDACSSRGGNAKDICLAEASGREKIAKADAEAGYRSEEHTSELQSRGHLVCRLLLE